MLSFVNIYHIVCSIKTIFAIKSSKAYKLVLTFNINIFKSALCPVQKKKFNKVHLN